MSNEQVDFLMEIMKAKTTTRQQQSQDDAPVEPFCTGCGVSDHDAEVRDQPPISSPEYPLRAFDYYGNPITEQDQRALQQLGQLQQQLQIRDQPSNSSHGRLSYGFDYYGNPITEQQMLLLGIPKAHPPQLLKEDYSEFLEGKKAAVPPEAQLQKKAIMVDRGCVGEFGNCLRITFCCGVDEDELVEAANSLDTPLTREENDQNRRDEQHRALRKAGVAAKASMAMLEYELRAEMTNIRRQKIEMEESYRREIASELSQKCILQAQLQTKLLSMMEERMLVEVQLDRLEAGPKPSPTESLPSQSTELIPTAICTPMNSSTDSQKGKPAQPMNSSPDSQKGKPTQSSMPRSTPMDSSPDSQKGKPAHSSVSRKPPSSPDPPTRGRVPVDPIAVTSSTVLTSAPKHLPGGMTKATPFGLSIVVENSNASCAAGASVASFLTPSANRSFSPQAAAMDNTDRSPPASNRSCEPEGRSFEKPDSPSSGNQALHGVHQYTSLPLPVATPVGMTRKFEASE